MLALPQQSLDCLYIFAFVDNERCEAVAEVVEAESLTKFETDTVPYKFVPRTLGTICKTIELAIDRKP